MQLSVNAFGIEPNSPEDATFAFQTCLAQARQAGERTLITLEKGVYHFYRENAQKVKYDISNTASQREAPDKTRHIGLLFKNLQDVTLDGGGSTLIFHGKFTMAAVDHAGGITLKNLIFDYARPTVSEMTVLSCRTDVAEFRVHPDSSFELREGRLVWTGPGFSYTDGPTQQYDPASDTTWRVRGLDYSRAETPRPGVVRLYLNTPLKTKPGNVYQIRDGIRDEVGVLLNRSEDIALRDLTFRFMHGLGILAQFTQNVTVERVECVPDPAGGRTCAAFADCVHFSGCRGSVRVADCHFCGAHDDGVNVHGIHLRVEEISGPRELTASFCHDQTYGFPVFFARDQVEYVDAQSLLPLAGGRVERAELIAPDQMKLTMQDSVPPEIRPGHVLENLTWTPEVTVTGCRFSRIPTRGVLVTTRRKAVVENNVFQGTGMSGVLVGDDALSWYESGPVRDLTLRGNQFLRCGGPVICIQPENTLALGPVHENILIEKNRFELIGPELLSARCVRGLIFRNNIVAGVPPAVGLDHCEQVLCTMGNKTE